MIWIWIIIANLLLLDIAGMKLACLRARYTADSWLLKDDTEANKAMESGSEFHSAIVLAAKRLRTDLRHYELFPVAVW